MKPNYDEFLKAVSVGAILGKLAPTIVAAGVGVAFLTLSFIWFIGLPLFHWSIS